MNHQKVIDTIQSKNKGGKLLLVAVGGSQSYGLATPTSDWDYKGICFAPARSYIGIGNVFEQIEFKDADAEFEGTVYEIRKWLGLAAACNPNIVEMLFTNEEHHVFRNDLDGMEFLMENREKFITKKAQHTFSGYAHAQLKRIKTHRNWLLNPLGSKPKRTDYGLSANHKAGKNLLESSQGALVALEERGAEAGLSESAISLLRAEQTYKNDLDHWNQYQHWLRTRNKARAALEAKCGYDCYHEDTEFLTEAGWLKYDEINNQRLATVNVSTGVLEYQNHTNRISKQYSGTMYEIHTQDGLCSITPSHQVLVSTTHRSKANNYSTTYKQKESAWKLEPLSSLINSRKSYFHIRAVLQNRQQDYDVSDDYLRLIGLYVSEGSMIKRQTKRGIIYKGISISQLELGRSCSIIGQITEYPYSTHSFLRNNRNELTFNFYDKNLANQLVHDCGELSVNKKLPTWISFLSQRQAKILLAALVSGDGTERIESDIYYTVSPMLADQVQMLGILCGFNTKMWRYPYTNTIQVYLKKKPNETNTMKTNGKQTSLREVTYDGNVVCFTVPNGTLVTRLRGETAIQGNCKHGMHLVRLLRMCTEILETGKIYVNRTHIDREELLEIRNGAWSYDRLIEHAESLQERCKAAAKTSTLPESVDMEWLNTVCMSLVEGAVFRS